MIKHFNYFLTGTGWAEVFFSNDRENVRFDTSYLSDPLSELFEGLYRLVTNHSDMERIVFLDEPGEHSLMITRQNKDSIKVEIFWSDEWDDFNNQPKTHAKKEVYSDNDSLINFSTVICLGIRDLLERQTLDEYKQKWHLYEFPIESYNKLRQAINLT